MELSMILLTMFYILLAAENSNRASTDSVNNNTIVALKQSLIIPLLFLISLNQRSCKSFKTKCLSITFWLKNILLYHVSSHIFEGVHLTLPPHIISVQVKSWSMLHHWSVGASLKQNKTNLKKPNPNPNS